MFYFFLLLNGIFDNDNLLSYICFRICNSARIYTSFCIYNNVSEDDSQMYSHETNHDNYNNAIGRELVYHYLYHIYNNGQMDI